MKKKYLKTVEDVIALKGEVFKQIDGFENLKIVTSSLKEYADRTNWIEGNFMCICYGRCFAEEESAERALKEMEGVK